MFRRTWVFWGLAALAFAIPSCAVLRAPAPDSADDPIAAYRTQAEDVRGLRFGRRVPVEWFGAADARALVRREVHGELTPDEIRRVRDLAVALGLLEPDYPLAEQIIELTADQVAGLYSPRRRTMYVRSESGGVRDVDAGIVVHELVHALQHEHLGDTMELMQSLRHSDDVVMAISAALEGDATLAMLDVEPADAIARAGELRDAMIARFSGPQSPFAAYPRVLSESLLVFPYAYGVAGASRHYAVGGNAGLDAWLADPPIATLAFLHPEEEGAIEFVRLDTAAIAARTRCALGHDDIVGAQALSVLLRDFPPSESTAVTVAGWRGDRIAYFECDAGWELAWVSRWRDAEAAERFARAYRELAPAIARGRPLHGVPRAVRSGQTVAVFTDGVAPLEAALLAPEIRGYESLRGWRADDCFPEGCPVP